MLTLIQWPAFIAYLLSALCVSLRRDIIVITVSQTDPWAVFFFNLIILEVLLEGWATIEISIVQKSIVLKSSQDNFNKPSFGTSAWGNT